MRSFYLLSLLSSVFILSSSPSQAQHSRRHEKAHARRHRYATDTVYKRDANVAFTYFEDGLGACGTTSGPSDFIVALNSAEYEGGAHCFEMITITVNGKTAQAQIIDECTGCSQGGLDFSSGLFQYFAPLSEGELYGSWSYNSDMTTSSSTAPTPTSSSSSTWTPSTTVGATTTSSSQASSTTIMTSSVSTVVPSSTSITSAVPTSTAQYLPVIAQFDLALLEFGALLQVSLKL